MKLRYTKRALADLDRILAYLAQRSPQGASHVLGQIDETIRHLVAYPRLGRQTNRSNIRMRVTGDYPYLIFYRVTRQNEISILHIRHGARRPFAR